MDDPLEEPLMTTNGFIRKLTAPAPDNSAEVAALNAQITGLAAAVAALQSIPPSAAAGVPSRGILAAAGQWGTVWTIPAAPADTGMLRTYWLKISLGEDRRTTDPGFIVAVTPARGPFAARLSPVVPQALPAYVRLSGNDVQLQSAYAGFGLRWVVETTATAVAGSGQPVPAAAWGDQQPVPFSYTYILTPDGTDSTQDTSRTLLNDGVYANMTAGGNGICPYPKWSQGRINAAPPETALVDISLGLNGSSASKVKVTVQDADGFGISPPSQLSICSVDSNGTETLLSSIQPTRATGEDMGTNLYLSTRGIGNHSRRYAINLPQGTYAYTLRIKALSSLHVSFTEVEVLS